MPIAAAQMQARWIRRGSRSQPNIHSPMNVDSMKNASRASIASGAPNTSPTNREYALQFMPNWNSCTMPGHHAHREVDQEELAEELGQPQPALVCR